LDQTGNIITIMYIHVDNDKPPVIFALPFSP